MIVAQSITMLVTKFHKERRIQEPNATSIEIIFVELWKESIKE